MVPQSVIDEILSRTSLSDLFARYTEVKQSGKNTMALCPFHQEKSPSLSISDEKGLYHCFGCGASGNALTFLMNYRKMNFHEAIEELAHTVGIDLSPYQGKDGQNFVSRKPLFDLLKDLAGFYHSALMSDPQAQRAREYLQKRGLTKETTEKFLIGWGGQNWQFAVQYLKSKGYSDELLLLSGVAIKGNKGLFDRFRGRIIFPIWDREDRLVGFGGRIIENNLKSAKYLNSPENPIFHKGQLLFGLNLARKSIKEKDYVFIVEGYLDVIGLAQVGIPNALAPLGTALTKWQLNLLKRDTSNIIFVFDGDEAGIRAANRALDIGAEEDLKQRVLVIPDKKDPFDIAMQGGKDAFLRMVKDHSLTPIDFKLKFLAKSFSPKRDSLRFLRSVFSFIALNPSKVTQDEMLRKTSAFLRIRIEVLIEEFELFLSKNKKFGENIKNIKKVSSIPDTEIHLLALLLIYPKEIYQISDLINSDLLIHPESKRIFEFISHHTDKNTKELFSAVKDSKLLKVASEYAVMPEAKPDMVREVAAKVKISALHRALKHSRRQHRQDEQMQEQLKRDQEIVEEIHRLEKEINHLPGRSP